jgi:excisionase family DNA binding protein
VDVFQNKEPIMQEAKLPELLTVKQVAKYLKVSCWTIRRWMHIGALPYIRIGKKYFIRRDTLPK